MKSIQGEMDSNGPATTFYRASMILCALLTLLSLIELILASVLPNTSIEAEVAYAIAPTAALPILFIVIVLSLIINPIGFVGLLKGSRKITVIHFFSSALLILFLLGVFVFLVMVGNGVVVSSNRNVNSNLAEPSGVAIGTFADDTQRRIVQFSLDEPDSFKEFQDANDCCGFNAQAIFGFGLDGFDPIEFHSGDNCIAINNEIDEVILASGGEFNAEALTAIAQTDRLGSDGFLCEEDFAFVLRELAQNFSILLGVQAFFQVTLAFFIGLLTYMYERREGGLKPDEASLQSKPKVENTVLVKAGYSTGKKKEGRPAIASVKSNKGKPGQNTGNQHIRFG